MREHRGFSISRSLRRSAWIQKHPDRSRQSWLLFEAASRLVLRSRGFWGQAKRPIPAPQLRHPEGGCEKGEGRLSQALSQGFQDLSHTLLHSHLGEGRWVELATEAANKPPATSEPTGPGPGFRGQRPGGRSREWWRACQRSSAAPGPRFPGFPPGRRAGPSPALRPFG